MSVQNDSESPMASLENAGAEYQRVETSSSSSFSINGVPVSTNTSVGVRYEWTLPGNPSLHVVFAEEGLGDKLAKIFKKELQVGDPLFDDAVYIDTDDKDATAAFLEDETIRNTVFGVITSGGTIAINGSEVIYEIAGGETDEDLAEMAHLVAKVMG